MKKRAHIRLSKSPLITSVPLPSAPSISPIAIIASTK